MSHVSHAMSDLAMVVRSQQRETALAGLHQSGNHAQQRALAGTVIAQHHVQATRREAGGDAADGGKTAKKFHQVFENDSRRGGWDGADFRVVSFRDTLSRTFSIVPSGKACSLTRISEHSRQSELEPLFYADEAVVDIHHLAGKIVELFIEAAEAQVHVRAQIADASVLKVKSEQNHNQRQAERGEKLSIAHKAILGLHSGPLSGHCSRRPEKRPAAQG